MTFQKGHHPGAEWHKADFQCHTPRDHQWNGSPHLPGGNETAEAARAAWAASFVDACLSKGLKAVAVTDHHDACMVDYVHKHVAATGCDLKVFAGVEVTCDDDVQCLAIFDPSSTASDWARFLHKLTSVSPATANDDKTCAIRPCGMTIAGLFGTVFADPRLKEICLLIPHFGKPEAHKSLNAERHHIRFINLECDGFYFEVPFSDLDSVTLQKARGEIREWGTRRRAMIATGDNRRATWQRLGAHDCWIKIGEFSTEAIRQAFLADEARIAHEDPSVPSERIIELRVKSTLTGTAPLTMLFNAGYTAFIGGRGSGKSSLLEYLRFGLGRADQDFRSADGLKRAARQREAELLRDTLVDGYVEVVLERDGSRETWRRNGADPATIEVTGAGRDPEKLTPEGAQARFRARAFHQKELSTTMTDSKAAAADHITGIVAAEALDRRRTVDRKIENAKRALTTALQKVAARWQVEFEFSQAKQAVADLKHRIGALNKRLKEEGVNEESLTVLEKAPLYGRARNFFASSKNKAQEDLQSLVKLTDSLVRIDFAALKEANYFPEVAEAEAALLAGKDKVMGHLRLAATALEQVQGSLKACSDKFEASSRPFHEELEKATAAQQTNKALLDELKKLTTQLTDAEAASSSVAEKLMDSLARAEEFTSALTSFDVLLEERREILREAARLVETRSGNLEAKMKLDKQPEEYLRALTGLLEGSTVRDADGRCLAWLASVTGDGDLGWSKVREDVIAIYQAKISAGKPQSPEKAVLDRIVELCGGGEKPISEQAAARIYSRLSDQIVGEVISATPRDFIHLTYVDETRYKVPFDRASPGQQASALLELLLKQEAGTLIVDQPEDDLDNRVIMRIVNLINTKSR